MHICIIAYTRQYNVYYVYLYAHDKVCSGLCVY